MGSAHAHIWCYMARTTHARTLFLIFGGVNVLKRQEKTREYSDHGLSNPLFTSFHQGKTDKHFSSSDKADPMMDSARQGPTPRSVDVLEFPSRPFNRRQTSMSLLSRAHLIVVSREHVVTRKSVARNAPRDWSLTPTPSRTHSTTASVTENKTVSMT